jgi:hypothetical protein
LNVFFKLNFYVKKIIFENGLVPIKKLPPKDTDFMSESGLTSARSGSVSSFNTSRRSGSKRGGSSRFGGSQRGASGGNTGMGNIPDTIDDDHPLILELEEEDDITKFDESRKLFKMLQKSVSLYY